MSKKFKKKQKITYLKERAVLSDTLPYETPAIFSNRYFYRFLVNNKIEIQDSEISFDNTNPDIIEILKLLLNLYLVLFCVLNFSQLIFHCFLFLY